MSPEPSLKSRYDVIVAGARVAGASTALLLAREGLDVLVVDPLPRGRDTLSTHALMRGAVLQLHRWGVLDRVRAAGTPPIRATTFDYGDETITIPIQARDGVDALYAPRRTVLDPLLAEAAEAEGARVVHGTSVVGLLRAVDGRVGGAWLAGADGVRRAVSADLVVGADGVHSRVARLVEAPVEHLATHASASVYGYWRGVEREGNRWTFRRGLGMGTIPTNDGATCVFVSMSPGAFALARARGLDQALRELVVGMDPELAELLTEEGRVGVLHGFPGRRGFLRRPVGPGWALVGDAGYFKDPLTAHGITDALRDAELLARAVVAGSESDLEGYGRARDRAALGLMEVTDRIASLEWSLAEVKALHERLAREMNGALRVLLEGVSAQETAA